MSEHKIINDPVFGFIKVPKGLLFNIVEHPYFQRLTRIKQAGMAWVVFPGAQHTRFHHSLGAFHLTTEAILTLSQKGIFIFDVEAEAVQAAILLHDVGHGPFSHVLENTLITGISHEEISLMIMQRMNEEMHGALSLAIKVFKNEYPKRFLHQLISSQLDMDRLDYLRRDSFFYGVVEGNIGSERIIKMLNVVDDRLVVDAKGIYSVENYLMSRRMMYWQLYLHKTTVACEKILVNLLRRAKYLASNGVELFCSPSLRFFLYNQVDAACFLQQPDVLDNYLQLDDSDLWCSVKVWAHHSDKILSLLAENLLKRRLFKVEIYDDPISELRIADLELELCNRFSVSRDDASYLYSVNVLEKDMYNLHDDRISILYKDGTLKDIAEASELLNATMLCQKNRKYYLCYQRF